MSEPGSSVRNCSEDAFAAQSNIGSTDIKFTTKTYRTGQQASDAYAALQSKAKSGSDWGRVSKFETGDAGSAEFELRCRNAEPSASWQTLRSGTRIIWRTLA
jgi:hypothetical protein